MTLTNYDLNKFSLIARHIKEHLPNISEALIQKNIKSTCAISGTDITEGILISKALTDTFTDYDQIKGKSDYISLDAYMCMANFISSREGAKRFIGIRQKNHLATEKEFKFLDLPELMPILLKPPEPPFVLTVTFDYKKHTIFANELNYNQNSYIVGTDQGSVKVELPEFKQMYEIAQRWYTVIPNKKQTYFTKEQILTGIAGYKQVIEYGLDQFIKDLNELGKLRKSDQFKLLVHCLQKKEN